MNLTTAIQRVASRRNKNANDATVASRIKANINDSCLEKWNGYAWSFRYREYPLVLSPRVTSGTLTATNGSQAVTATGTPFLATHVGAWVRFQADTNQAWYRVLTVSSTSAITIEPAYQGTSGSLKAYELNKTDYLLPLEVADVSGLVLTSASYKIPLTFIDSTDANFPPIGPGSPSQAAVFNQSQRATSYTTGTVTITASTTTLTGVGTAWLTNVTPGDEVVLNGDTNVYMVYSVDSDTSIQLYQKAMGALSAVTYSINRQFGKVIRLYPVADVPYVMYFRALRKYPQLINNSDSNELLERYPHAVVAGAIWRESDASPDPRSDTDYMKSESLWSTAMGEDEQLFPKHNASPIYNMYGDI